MEGRGVERATSSPSLAVGGARPRTTSIGKVDGTPPDGDGMWQAIKDEMNEQVSVMWRIKNAIHKIYRHSVEWVARFVENDDGRDGDGYDGVGVSYSYSKRVWVGGW